MVESVREKPVRGLKTILPIPVREKPVSPKKTTISIQLPPVDQVGTTIDQVRTDTEVDSPVSSNIVLQTGRPTEVYDESSSSDNEKPVNTRTFTRIPLSDDSDSDTFAPPKHSKTPIKKKHRSKTKTKTKLPDMVEITESINDISETITSTVELVGKNAVMGIVKTIIKSKQFMIILVLGTIFLGIGYCLRVIYR